MGNDTLSDAATLPNGVAASDIYSLFCNKNVTLANYIRPRVFIGYKKQ